MQVVKPCRLNPAKLRGLIEEIVQELSPLARDRGLELRTDFDEQAQDKVMGDCLEVRRLLINLVGNAIKFTDKGSITIRLTEADKPLTQGDTQVPGAVRCTVIEVEDTGAGIAEDEQATLFERFRQGNHKRSGSGLGMYLSRRIVEAHNGAIEVKSELGNGSLFTIWLPLSQG